MDNNTIRYVKKNRFKFIKIYNNLCPKCKTQCKTEPGRAMNKYCDDCQDMIKKVLQ